MASVFDYIFNIGGNYTATKESTSKCNITHKVYTLAEIIANHLQAGYVTLHRVMLTYHRKNHIIYIKN